MKLTAILLAAIVAVSGCGNSDIGGAIGGGSESPPSSKVSSRVVANLDGTYGQSYDDSNMFE